MPKGQATAQTPEQKAAAKAEREALKASNFAKLANARMEKALAAISVIGNLSNKGSYTYTPAQIQGMYDALTGQVDKTFRYFNPDSKEASTGFDVNAAAAKVVEETEGE